MKSSGRRRRPNRMRVAFQGELGAYSQLAVHQLLGERVELLPCAQFRAVFEAVAEGQAEAAVIPIENSLHGSVHENYDHLLEFGLAIVGETQVRISHNLIAHPEVRLRNVRRVFSHPVALNQCLRFFAAHPELERVPFYDTAGSVKMLMEQGLRDAAAIASSAAAETYGARILRRAIEDDRANFTRFFLLRRDGEQRLRRVKEWKTTLAFSTRNIPGALFRALSAFALRDINLSKIESRPLRGRPWEYLFYVDFLGHVDEPRCRRALEHLGELADTLKVLGCYPKGA